MSRIIPVLTALATLPAAFAAETVITDRPELVKGAPLGSTGIQTSAIDISNTPAIAVDSQLLSDSFANLYIATSGARSFNDTTSLRGLTNTPIFGDPSATVYLDEIPLVGAFTLPGSLALFSNAEVLRGPGQNTRFGRAGSAGVIQLSLPTASAQSSGRVTSGMGSDNALWGSAVASSASSGQVYASAGFEAQSRDGYVTNTKLNDKVDDQESQSAFTRLGVHATDAIELSLVANALRARDGAQPMVPLGGPRFRVDRSAEGRSDLNAVNAGLNAKVNSPWGLLSATSSVNDWKLNPFSSTLAFAPGMELGNQVALAQRNYNQELKLASDAKASLHWNAGAFFSDGNTDGRFARNFGPYPYENSAYRIGARQLAGYGEASFEFTPAISLTAGLRAEQSRKSLFRSDLLVPTGNYTDAAKSSALLPKLELNLKLDSQTTVFTSLGAGYKPGGFSAFTRNAALSSFTAERTRAAEVGLTRESADRTLHATLRGFWYEISNYQIERSFQTGTNEDDYLVVNAPKARSTGGELELGWTPLAGLRVSAALGVTQVILRDFRDPYTGILYDGRRAPYVPQYDASLDVEYRHRSGLFVGAGGSAAGRVDYTEANTEAFAQKARALLDARVGYASQAWSITLFGRNLTDRAYISSIAPGTNHGTPGTPRTWGLEGSFRF